MHPAGKTFLIPVVPVLDTNAYTSGDCLGANPHELVGAARLPNHGGVILSVAVLDKAAQSLALDVLFFSKRPQTAIPANNAAFTLNATDALSLIGIVSVAATDYSTVVSGTAFARVEKMLPYNINPAAGEARDSLWAVFVTRGAPTYAVGSLEITPGMIQD